MFAGFNLHKRHKLRLREQFLLTKRHQCISLMELGSEESKNKIQESLESIWYNAVSRLLAVYECHPKETKNYKKFWWLNDLKQLDWYSCEASISSENNSEPLEFDQVKAVTPMLAGFNWRKRYNKLRMRNKKLSSRFESMQSSIVCSLSWPPKKNHKRKSAD